jgi:signal transduction histidine kinase
MGTIVKFLKGGRTALRKAETALEAALIREQGLNRTCRRMATELSHQFRAPLRAMLCSTRVLADETYGTLGDPRYANEAEAVHRSVLHLLRVSDPERIKAGGDGTQKASIPIGEDIDARDMIERVVMMFRQMAENNEVDLTYEIDDDFPLLRTDATRLNQVLINVMSDALDNTPSGGAINIDALLDPSGKAIILVIHDFGLGLSEDKLRKALKPLDKNDAFENTGEGLAISIANRLMRELSGEMTLSSMEGKGTLISLSFPIELTSGKPKTDARQNLGYPFSR